MSNPNYGDGSDADKNFVAPSEKGSQKMTRELLVSKMTEAQVLYARTLANADKSANISLAAEFSGIQDELTKSLPSKESEPAFNSAFMNAFRSGKAGDPETIDQIFALFE